MQKYHRNAEGISVLFPEASTKMKFSEIERVG
jgi:hypothetical protein